jgi:regulator of replication initiation timing
MEQQINELIKENNELKIRITELEKQLEEKQLEEKQLEEILNKDTKKKLIPPSQNNINKYGNDNYFYWI